MSIWKLLLICAIALPVPCSSAAAEQSADILRTNSVGQAGGRLVVALRAEPKTLNPVTAVDSTSRDVIRRLQSDLVRIDRITHRTEPSLAKSWTTSRDGMSYTVHLRRGLRFSDGQPFDADDVMFSFQIYEDEKVHSPQRDLLVVDDKPLQVRKLDQYTVQFEFSRPYAAGDRLFDSVAILPRHALETAYKEGKLAQAWTLATPPAQIAGLGPYRLKQYVPGQSITLERNPYYWKQDASGKPLPYLDQITFLIVPSDDAQVLRFESGETDMVNRISADNFDVLARQQRQRGFQMSDAGPGLEYNFLLLNLNDDTANRLPEVVRKQKWFRDLRFRQAISSAIDRESIVRLVYRGRGVPLWAQVTPGNKMWVDQSLPHPARNLEHARALLRESGFHWSPQGNLIDNEGQNVRFTIIAASSNAPRSQMATIIQQDLKQLGIEVQVVPLEFRAYLDRMLNTHDYDAAIAGLVSGDVDPTAEMNVWLSSGSTHVWNLGEKQPATRWEAEIDHLMQQQASTLDPKERKRMYDRVQQIVAEQLPIICLAAPDILVGAKAAIGNFRPAIMEHYTLHNADELYWRKK